MISEEKAKPKFNIGINYVIGLHELLNGIRESRINKDGRMLCELLQSLYIELKAQMEDKEKEDADTKLGEVFTALKKEEKASKRRKPFATAELVDKCIKMEEHLREVMHRFDFLVPLDEETDSF